MTSDQLSTNLGFSEGLPIVLFNKYRHRAGLTPWSAEYPDCLDPEGPHKDELDPIKLHWHQLAGVHAMVRKLIVEQDGPECCGILLADEVGLGKTFQAITMIAFLSDLVIRQGFKLPPPPMIRKTILFCLCASRQ